MFIRIAIRIGVYIPSYNSFSEKSSIQPETSALKKPLVSTKKTLASQKTLIKPEVLWNGARIPDTRIEKRAL